MDPSSRRRALALATAGAVLLAHAPLAGDDAGQITYLTATVGAAVLAWAGVAHHPRGSRLLDLSRTLRLETVAEGIESEAQRERLRDERCALGQGFLFARPLPAAEAEELLRQAVPVG